MATMPPPRSASIASGPTGVVVGDDPRGHDALAERRRFVREASRRGPGRGRARPARGASISWATPSSSSGGATYRAAARTARRRGRHRRPVADLGEHLEVVPLVADGERRAERDPEATGEPPDGAALRHARRDELEEARVADRDVRPSGEGRDRARGHLGRERRFADREDLRHRVLDRVERGWARARPGRP